MKQNTQLGRDRGIAHIIDIKHKHVSLYAIWLEGDEGDSELQWDDIGIICFMDWNTCRDFAEAKGHGISTEPIMKYDLDSIADWATSPIALPVDCDLLLNFVNFIDDATPIGEEREGLRDRQQGDIYHKLFWGNNLVSVTPPGEHYIPTWSEDELTELQEMVEEGLAYWSRSMHLHEG